MTTALPCAIYTRKSSEEGLEQDFNSLHAQREACSAFILSQKALGWVARREIYDDGGYSGGTLERPALQRLLSDIAAQRVKVVVVYKVDRLSRSLADFAKMVELFDAHGVSFVSVTQQFNTTSSMGRLTLNVLLSFAQFEREVTGERIRDKIAASKRKGMWMGGVPPVGYVPAGRSLAIDDPSATQVREIYRLYLELDCVRRLKLELDRRGWVTPARQSRRQGASGGRPFSRGHLYRILGNPVYVGQIMHKGQAYPGNHPALIETALWQAVQDRLASNRQGQRRRAGAAQPSLLAGLLFDAYGIRLTASHAQKGSRRYRYYVGTQPMQDGDATARALRIPAQELEDAVRQALTIFLNDEPRLSASLGEMDAATMQRRLQAAKALVGGLMEAPGEQIRTLVRRVTVHQTELEIVIRLGALAAPDIDSARAEGTTVIRVPMQLKRCGMAVRLIVQAPGEAARVRQPDAALVALLVKAQDWAARLTSGQSISLAMIAQAERVSSSHVGRVIHLGFLAPDIVQRIARGQQPLELNAKQLLRQVPLPIDWEQQRALLGFYP